MDISRGSNSWFCAIFVLLFFVQGVFHFIIFFAKKHHAGDFVGDAVLGVTDGKLVIVGSFDNEGDDDKVGKREGILLILGVDDGWRDIDGAIEGKAVS